MIRAPFKAHLRPRLIRIGFAALLLSPWLAGIKTNPTPDRQPAAWPQLTLQSLGKTETYRAIDAVVKDHIAARPAVVSGLGQGAFALGRLSLSPKVISLNGNLLFAEDFTNPCPYVASYRPDLLQTQLTDWTAAAALNGRKLLLMVPPDKSQIVSSAIPKSLSVCQDAISTKTAQTFTPTQTPEFIDLKKSVTAIQQRFPTDTYQHGDSHWTQIGAMAFLGSAIASLEPSLVPEVRSQLDHPIISRWNRAGDLYRLMGFNRNDSVPRILSTRPGVTTIRTVKTSPSGRQEATYITSTAGPKLVPGKTLIIHDSFGAATEEPMAPYFSHLEYLHWNDFVPAAKNGKMPAFDNIIFESVDRILAERAVTVLLDPAISATVTKELVGARVKPF
jgi:hypothetical protein